VSQKNDLHWAGYNFIKISLSLSLSLSRSLSTHQKQRALHLWWPSIDAGDLVVSSRCQTVLSPVVRDVGHAGPMSTVWHRCAKNSQTVLGNVWGEVVPNLPKAMGTKEFNKAFTKLLCHKLLLKLKLNYLCIQLSTASKQRPPGAIGISCPQWHGIIRVWSNAGDAGHWSTIDMPQSHRYCWSLSGSCVWWLSVWWGLSRRPFHLWQTHTRSLPSLQKSAKLQRVPKNAQLFCFTVDSTKVNRFIQYLTHGILK